MKILSSLFTAVLFSGCANSTDNDLQTFIPGRYVRYAMHEFGEEWDTLHITEQNISANQYKFKRCWHYERLLDGFALQPEYKISTSSGIYSSAKKGIVERSTGKLITFDEMQGTLFAGKVKYQKLK